MTGTRHRSGVRLVSAASGGHRARSPAKRDQSRRRAFGRFDGRCCSQAGRPHGRPRAHRASRSVRPQSPPTTHLHIKRPQESVDGAELGLDLDYQQGWLDWMPGENIYRAAIAELREGDFNLAQPIELSENFHYLADQPSVALIQESIDLRS